MVAPREPVDIVAKKEVEDSGFNSNPSRGKTVFLFLITSRPALGPSQSPIQSAQGDPTIPVTS